MLKIAIFGAGHLGKFHLNNWEEIEDVKIIGFFDGLKWVGLGGFIYH